MHQGRRSRCVYLLMVGVSPARGCHGPGGPAHGQELGAGWRLRSRMPRPVLLGDAAPILERSSQPGSPREVVASRAEMRNLPEDVFL